MGRMTFFFHFLFLLLQGSPCLVVRFGLALLCTEDGSAVVIWLNNVILDKIVRYQVCKLRRQLLGLRHRKGVLYKVCYCLRDCHVEAMRIDLASCGLEGSIRFLSRQCFVG